MPSDIPTRDILKDDFNWEVPVDSVPLPSKGVIYDPNSRLYNREKLKIKAMTAREEDIMSSRALLQEGTAINHLIKSCLIDKDIDPNELTIGDRNALIVAIRITGYGSDYPVIANCASCNHSNELNIDLAELEIRRLEIKPIREGENKFLFKLPVTKKDVIFKFLSADDLNKIEAAEDFAKNKLKSKIGNSITTYLEHSIISVDGIKERHKISKFVRNMPAFDSKKLRNYIKDNEPKVIMEHKFNCQNCGFSNNSDLLIKSNFFWPQ